MRISDWSSDVCSSDLNGWWCSRVNAGIINARHGVRDQSPESAKHAAIEPTRAIRRTGRLGAALTVMVAPAQAHSRSEEHTSELPSLMRISYAVFCLKKKQKHQQPIDKSTRTHEEKSKQN